VTTLVDMPLNSIPPTTTVEHLEIKRASAKECGVYTDVGFWGGIIPGNAADLKPLIQAGVKGFKCFLIESGVDVSGSLLYDESSAGLLRTFTHDRSFPASRNQTSSRRAMLWKYVRATT